MLRRLGIGLLLASLATLWLLRGELPAPMVGDAVTSQAEEAPTIPVASDALHRTTASTPPTPNPPGADQRERATTTAARHGPPQDTVTVRLVGLHADAPWTTKLEMQAGVFHPRRPVVWQKLEQDVHGDTATYVFDTAGGEVKQGTVWLRDPLYAALDHRFELAGDEPISIQVRPRCILRGRVVDERGQPLANLHVSVHMPQCPTCSSHSLDGATTEADGTFELQAPPASELLVVAAEPRDALLLRSRRRLAAASSSPTTVEKPQRLPASATVHARIGRTTLPDLVMVHAAVVHGDVCWSNREPPKHAYLRLRAPAASTLGPAHPEAMQLLANGSVIDGRATTTRADGHFRMSLPETSIDDLQVELILVDDYAIEPPLVARPKIGEPLRFVAPRPVTVRCLLRGQDVEPDTIEFAGKEAARAPAGQRFTFLPVRPMRLRGTFGAWQSAWLDVGPEDGGKVLDLDLVDERCALRLLYPQKNEIRRARVAWRAANGTGGEQLVLAPHRSYYLSLFLPAGRYQLVVTPESEDGHALHLPTTHDVELGPTPGELTIAIAKGGTLRITATNSLGFQPAGTATLIAPDGRTRTSPFRAMTEPSGYPGAAGELLPDAPNESATPLPEGDYELLLEFQGAAPRRERVRIKAGETTRVDVRLP